MRRFHFIITIMFAAMLAPDIANAGCTIFEHRDFGGASWFLNRGDTMKMVDGKSICTSTGGHCPECETCTLFEPSWNDAVSSFTVDPGCTITLWQHVNEGGAYFRTYRSYSYIGDDWNDQPSEAACTCP